MEMGGKGGRQKSKGQYSYVIRVVFDAGVIQSQYFSLAEELWSCN